LGPLREPKLVDVPPDKLIKSVRLPLSFYAPLPVTWSLSMLLHHAFRQ